MFRVLNTVAALAVVVASLLIFSGHAYAHERRTVGPYQFVVGWLNEPAYVGQLNSLDLRISDTRQNPAAAVSGLEKTLTADLAAGGLAPYKLTVTARTFADLATQRGPTEEQERPSETVRNAAQKIVERCGGEVAPAPDAG